MDGVARRKTGKVKLDPRDIAQSYCRNRRRRCRIEFKSMKSAIGKQNEETVDRGRRSGQTVQRGRKNGYEIEGPQIVQGFKQAERKSETTIKCGYKIFRLKRI